MYKIGDKIVYPMHGAGTIDHIETKQILGEVRDYFILSIPYGDMKIMIPTDKCEEIGIRDIVKVNVMESVVTVLGGKSSEMPSNWNKRYRENMDKLKTGDILKVAEVVRNLMRVEQKKNLSTGEKKMLTNAKQILVSEIMLVKGIGSKEAEKLVEESI